MIRNDADGAIQPFATARGNGWKRENLNYLTFFVSARAHPVRMYWTCGSAVEIGGGSVIAERVWTGLSAMEQSR